MKHSWILILLLILGIGVSYGQRRPLMAQMNKERIESMRIAHYSNEMNLSAKEAQVFWPWFNEREEKLKKTRTSKNQKQRQMLQVISQNDEKAIEKVIDEFVDLKFQEAQIEKEYHLQLKEIMPIRKVVLFYKAEKEWQRTIIKFLQSRRERE